MEPFVHGLARPFICMRAVYADNDVFHFSNTVSSKEWGLAQTSTISTMSKHLPWTKRVQTVWHNFVSVYFSADGVVKRLSGHEVTPQYFHTQGFKEPILVEKKDGLGLRVPPPSITIEDVERRVGEYRAFIYVRFLHVLTQCMCLQTETGFLQWWDSTAAAIGIVFFCFVLFFIVFVMLLCW